MKTVIVFDSFFGNTEKIAHSIADGAASGSEVTLLQTTHVTRTDIQEMELLIVGSPTRGFKASPGIDNFLRQIPKNSLDKISTAAFDTRISPNDLNNRFISGMISRIILTANKIFGIFKLNFQLVNTYFYSIAGTIRLYAALI